MPWDQRERHKLSSSLGALWNPTSSMATQAFVDLDVFQQLQTKIDEDSELRLKIRDTVQELDKQRQMGLT